MECSFDYARTNLAFAGAAAVLVHSIHDPVLDAPGL